MIFSLLHFLIILTLSQVSCFRLLKLPWRNVDDFNIRTYNSNYDDDYVGEVEEQDYYPTAGSVYMIWSCI